MEEYNEERKGYHFDPITGEDLTQRTGTEAAEENTFAGETEQAETYQQYTFRDEVEPESAPAKEKKTKKERKPMRTGKKFAVVVAMAVIFGLVGGTVFYGVNYIGNRFFAYTPALSESNSSESAQVPSTEITRNAVPEALSEASSQDTDAAIKPELNVYTDESGKTATTTAGSVAEVAANCMPSLVTIASISVVEMQNFFGQTQQYEAQGAGSGVIVGQNDTELLIATNNHVVSGAKELSVGFIDETSVEAYVKGTDAENDLAVVAVKLEDISGDTLAQIRTATIGSSDDLVLGEQVVAIGNALGIGQSVTSGYVSALNRDMTFSDGSYTITSTQLIQTDAPINSGNSGGGLFNMKGELVGINEAKSSMTSSGTTVDGVGFAISIDKAEPILENLMTLETRETVDEENAGYLGVNCANVTSDIAKMYDMPIGVCFTNVMSGSPAEAAGVVKGDVLVEFAGRSIDSYETLKDELSYHAAGETVEMKVMRLSNGQYEEVVLSVTLGSYDEVMNLQQNG